MDKIILKELEFQGKHGCFQEEKEVPQKFKVDAELFLDLEKAMSSDDLKHTVNYGEVFEIIKNQIEEKSYNLIEKLTFEIIKEVFKYSETIKEIKITLIKIKPPVEGKYKYFAVEIRRSRDWLQHI